MRHAIRVMAGLALVLALAGWGLQWLLMPQDPDPPIEVEPLTAYQSMQLWLNLAAGIDDSYKHAVQQFITNRAERRFWSNVSLTAAALSLAVFAGTFVWPAPQAPRAPRGPAR